jgi:hypothetical protein
VAKDHNKLAVSIINFDKPVKYLGNLQLDDFEHYLGISARLDQGIKSNHSPITLSLGGGNRHDKNFFKTNMDRFQKPILIQINALASLDLAAMTRLHHRDTLTGSQKKLRSRLS